jgi:hypothetical protein
VGKSVHIIDFLLHVLQKDAKDERSFRQVAGKEVYPFVLLLPSRVEQYSFAERIAKSIRVPVDTVWHEIERLRDSQRTTQRELEKAPEPAGVVERSPSTVLVSHRTFLEASLQLLKGAEHKVLVDALQTLDLTKVPQPEQSDFARTVFTLEQQFSTMPLLAKQEELVSRLNQLRVGIIRKKLSELRQNLTSFEQEQNEKDQLETLQEIAEYEKKLREPGFDSGMFVG